MQSGALVSNKRARDDSSAGTVDAADAMLNAADTRIGDPKRHQQDVDSAPRDAPGCEPAADSALRDAPECEIKVVTPPAARPQAPHILEVIHRDALGAAHQQAPKSIGQKVKDMVRAFKEKGDTGNEAIKACRKKIYELCDRDRLQDPNRYCKGSCRYMLGSVKGGRTFFPEPGRDLCCVCAVGLGVE